MPFGTGKATLDMTGAHNRRLIFSLLRRYGRLSRQQLSDISTLHRSTLSKIISEFLDQGIVRVVGKRKEEKKRVGKKQILLEIRPEAGWTLGIGLNWEWADLVILGANGRVFAESRVQAGRDLSKVPQIVKAYFDEWLAKEGPPPGQFLGMGLGSPGIVDPDKGLVIYSHFYNCKTYPLARQMTEAFGLPIIMENDVRLDALAQLNRADEKGEGTFIFFNANYHPADGGFVIDDYGTALVLSGRIYRGAHYGSGELWKNTCPPPCPVLSPDDFAALAEPEAALTEPMKQVADTLAPYLANIAVYVDPNRLIIGGPVRWTNNGFIRYLEDRMNELVYEVPGRRIAIEPAHFPASSAAYGAALMAFDQVPVAELRAEN